MDEPFFHREDLNLHELKIIHNCFCIRIQKEADEAKEKILDYTEKLSKVAADKDSSDQKLFAELDDLTRTKQFLEERLIELIRLASK